MKLDITTIDKNFLIGSAFEHENLTWKNILEAPFSIHGLTVHEGSSFLRVPDEVSKIVSDGVHALSSHTAGGRVRFRTDSKRIAVRFTPLNSGYMNHMPLTGSAGIDAYINGSFVGIYRPQNDKGETYEGILNAPEGLNSIELNLPLYNGVTSVFVGLETGSTLLEPLPYAIEKPIVYYGSSITQGGCASRPGNSYQGHIERWLDADYINLGFSGNAKGETVMAKYIAGLDMSCFVMDYDHNAGSPEFLEATHEPFFKLIREAHPKLPVVFVTRPDHRFDADSIKRKAVVLKTYSNAIEAGDKHVYFVNGERLFGEEDFDACTVDTSHPNDLGFYRMAKEIVVAIKIAFKEI